MAILKEIQTEYKVPAVYWHIETIQENFVQKYVDITFLGYASESARRDGGSPMASGQTRITGDEYVAGADRAQLYAIIKQKPEFDGATDV